MASPNRGAYLAFLGIDGIGKTTAARRLCDELRAAGRPTELVSWKRCVTEHVLCGSADFPRPSLEQLWLESFRLFMGRASVNGQRWKSPSTLDQLYGPAGTASLVGAKITDFSPSGPLAAVWVELAANLLLRFEVIEPLLKCGTTVVQDSFGYKDLVKLLTMVARLCSEWVQPLELAGTFIRRCFGEFLGPDVGIHLRGSASMALDWRRRAGQAPSIYENFSVLGHTTEQSFLELQEGCAILFASFAEAHKWVVVTMQERPPEDNGEAILHALRDTSVASGLRRSPVA